VEDEKLKVYLEKWKMESEKFILKSGG